MNNKLRIVFMGTPEFASHILESLLHAGVEIVGVVTAPDKPSGRGQKLNKSAVKVCAEENQLNILQPTNLKQEDFLKELKALNADLFVVVAFRMLPEAVWSMPVKGTINLHASLLPDYRGAAPINWAIINGETKTGVTTFFIEKEIDTGKIIEQEEVIIGEDETVGQLHDRLMELGAKVTVSTVLQLAEKDIEGISQQNYTLSEIHHAPKIFKDDCKINFDQSVDKVHNFVRGLDPYPGAWTTLTNRHDQKKSTFKLFNAQKTEVSSKDNKELVAEKDGIYFPTEDFYLSIKDIQMEGKRRMDFKSFLAGNKLEDWVLEQ